MVLKNARYLSPITTWALALALRVRALPCVLALVVLALPFVPALGVRSLLAANVLALFAAIVATTLSAIKPCAACFTTAALGFSWSSKCASSAAIIAFANTHGHWETNRHNNHPPTKRAD